MVTTARLTHATPAALYAHSATRDWEADSDLPSGAECEDIASQLVAALRAGKLQLAFGGGRRAFTGSRRRGPDLVQQYRQRSKYKKMHRQASNVFAKSALKG